VSVLPASEPIVDGEGKPTLGFQLKFQRLNVADRTTVAGLPVKALKGTHLYVDDLCVFNGAGTQETTTNGTGGLVSFNGTNWVIVGTNVTASA
jgi:hypothetical protein